MRTCRLVETFCDEAASTSAISAAALGAGLDARWLLAPISNLDIHLDVHEHHTRPPPLGPGDARDWATLAASLTGTLVRPSSASYATASLLYNEKFIGLHPQGIAYCASSEDVARCVDFATSHQMAMCARSGGHSYAGLFQLRRVGHRRESTRMA